MEVMLGLAVELKILLYVAIGVFLLFFFNVIFIVKQQNIAIIERFGRYSGHAYPGLNVKLPTPISFVVTKVSLKVKQSEHNLSVKTKDNAFVSMPVKVQLKVIPEKVSNAYYQLEDATQQVNSFILNAVRSKSSSLDLEELYTKKSELADHVKLILEEKISGYGYEIVDVLVDEPEPSVEVKSSYNSVIASKRELEAARNEAEAKKALIIGEAEAEAKSLELKAISYAKQRKIIAEGINNALSAVSPNDIQPSYILEFLASIDYRDTIRDAAKSDSNTLIFSNDPAKDLKKLSPLLATNQQKNIKQNNDDAESEQTSEEDLSMDDVWQ